ncbi:hypothetical protein D3C73_1161170 [compost metagenome]
MIWLILLDESSMRPMAVTAERTMSPDFVALCLVACTMSRASVAREEAARTVAVISSRAAAVSSSAAACCSVRFDRSLAADDSSAELLLIVPAAPRTLFIVPRRRTIVLLTLVCSSANAPWNWPFMLCVRSASASAAITRRTSVVAASTLPTNSLTPEAKRLRSSFW